MKKTLIALATLALAGAASAQSTVTLSGKLAFAYSATESQAGAKANGLGVTDGDFVMSATEDLGGGLKASASMAVVSRGRDTAITGRDASISLSGGFGSVTIGAIELGNGLLGLGGADAPTIGMDGAAIGGRGVLSQAMLADMLLYTSPSMSGFSLAAAVLDMETTSVFGSTAGAAGAGGMESTSPSPDATLLGVNYAAGALAVAADFTKLGSNASIANGDRTRLSASYDLGMAKLGAGYERMTGSWATLDGNTQYVLGVSAPIGKALTVGANYASNSINGGNKVTGYELGANYALSKRTGVQVAYQSLKEENVSGDATTFRVRLMHSF
jgi:predicted porin